MPRAKAIKDLFRKFIGRKKKKPSAPAYNPTVIERKNVAPDARRPTTFQEAGLPVMSRTQQREFAKQLRKSVTKKKAKPKAKPKKKRK